MEIRILGGGDDEVFKQLGDGVFDRGVDARLTAEFLADPRHHLAVAMDDGIVVGFASGVHYVHPDKPAELFINEVGVAPTHQNRGIGKHLLDALLKVAKNLGCHEAWVLTDRGNAPAMRLYASLGGIEAPRDQVMFTFKLE